MNLIQSTLLALLPPKRKTTPSGWMAFNAACCHNRGENRDTRNRGGVLISPEGGWQYHCFNCNYKAGWTPGKLLSNNTKQLFSWLGLDQNEIGKLSMFALTLKDSDVESKKILRFELDEKSLPDQSQPLVNWAEKDLGQERYQDLVEIFKYLDSRGMHIDWYSWHWSPIPGFKDRLLIPFYHHDKIVGYTGRKITEGKPKYLTDAQPGYVFNLDRQTAERKFVIVVEGQFDAIAIDACAIMHNEPNQTQIQRINSLGKEVIVVPDRDRAGSKLLRHAIDNNWSMSLPPWGDNIKDVADAVKQYGRLYVIQTILHYKENSKIKIELTKKKLEKLHA